MLIRTAAQTAAHLICFPRLRTSSPCKSTIARQSACKPWRTVRGSRLLRSSYRLL